MSRVIVCAGTLLQRAPHVLAEEVDGVTVLLDPVADRYSRLNGTGGFLFARLADGPLTAGELAADLAARSGIGQGRALDDVIAFARALAGEGLVETLPPG